MIEQHKWSLRSKLMGIEVHLNRLTLHFMTNKRVDLVIHYANRENQTNLNHYIMRVNFGKFGNESLVKQEQQQEANLVTCIFGAISGFYLTRFKYLVKFLHCYVASYLVKIVRQQELLFLLLSFDIQSK